VYYLGRPSDLQFERIKGLEKELDTEKAKVDALWNNNLFDINTRFAKRTIPFAKVLTKEEYGKTGEKQ
ncbi:MAG: hypothetical protein JJE25_05175, partial [Bacteroidia bacterium]|nr:hypothetical protein [Bacteroidia bacterium]